MARGRAAALLVAALVVASIASEPAFARPPNIVVILADDLGYSDLGSYGGELDTPVLDRLAFAGVRFTRFYATPRCSPTRAALLTGVWSHEAGVAHLDRDWETPAYRGAIHDSVPTIAERLRALGYATYMVGKWHLSPERLSEPVEAPASPSGPPSWPLQRGFDVYYGTLAGSGSYFDPARLYEGNQPAVWPPEGTAGEASEPAAYLTDVLGARAASLVERHLESSSEQPFFLYLPLTAPHWPLQAPAADVERYRGRFDAGWDELRAARFARQRELGIVAGDASLPARDAAVMAWAETADREWQARRMEVYAAMVAAMDRAAGNVIAALERAGALDDTVVIFLSDNGACAEEFRGLYTLAPLFVDIPERTADGSVMRFGDRPDIEPGPADTWTTYGRGWAQLSNTPLRGYKHWTHEGGIAVPFFVHWPANLATRAGAIVTTPGHVIDLAPTLDEIARDGAEPSAESAHDPPWRGSSLLALLRGEAVEPRTLYWEHEGNRAAASGDWKLVSRWPFGWELYDLASDRFETDDLAAANQERVAELSARWTEWAAAVGVEPWPLVVPWVRTALSFGVGVAAFVILVGRALGARRAGAPPRTPGPFPGGKSSPPDSPRRAEAPPHAPEAPPAPIRPR